MPKIKMTFNLPEDQAEFDFAIQGADMYNVLWEMKSELRSMLKYGELSEEQYEVVQKIQEFLINRLDDHLINLNK